MRDDRTRKSWLAEFRAKRGAQLAVANLRILIGFAFLPAGLKKLLGEPFTDPDKIGVFHEFLHAFHAAGPMYRLVGVVQLTAAVLLLSQRFATLGAVILLPVLVAINALCWSSFGIPTIVVVALMLLGTLGLLAWDWERWRALFVSSRRDISIAIAPSRPRIDWQLWERCGLAILVVYVAACALSGGVYRPRGAELGNPAFYLLPTIAMFPVVTWIIDRARYRAGRRKD